MLIITCSERPHAPVILHNVSSWERVEHPEGKEMGRLKITSPEDTHATFLDLKPGTYQVKFQDLPDIDVLIVTGMVDIPF